MRRLGGVLAVVAMGLSLVACDPPSNLSEFDQEAIGGDGGPDVPVGPPDVPMEGMGSDAFGIDMGPSMDAPPPPPDASVDIDAPPDVAIDAPQTDASMPDASMPDASMPDASMPDASMPDASMPDAGLPDGGVVDAPSDAVAPHPDSRGVDEKNLVETSFYACSTTDAGALAWLPLFGALAIVLRGRGASRAHRRRREPDARTRRVAARRPRSPSPARGARPARSSRRRS